MFFIINPIMFSCTFIEINNMLNWVHEKGIYLRKLLISINFKSQFQYTCNNKNIPLDGKPTVYDAF